LQKYLGWDRILSMSDRIVSDHPVLVRRTARNWSQAQLAERIGISRAAVSAIEGRRLSPAVSTALALAEVFDCSVEELFAPDRVPKVLATEWAWEPRGQASRYWEAEIEHRRLRYPVEAPSLNAIPHDGVWKDGIYRERGVGYAQLTLTMASCDPGAGLLSAEYARLTGFRLLLFPRGGLAALELLRRRLVHVAALHRSTPQAPERNAETVRERLGTGFKLVRFSEWEEGVAIAGDSARRSIAAIGKETSCWAAREPGSGARECLDELLAGRRFSGRELPGHATVAEAVRDGWAEAGVCVRLSAEEAGLRFLPIRKESLDFCFHESAERDRLVRALIGVLRTRAFGRLVSELPGYETRHTGELVSV
jgi:molybdate-binding protein/transcriptional regulator with XRE-family HTH domain